jgi:hypothetical protein
VVAGTASSPAGNSANGATATSTATCAGSEKLLGGGATVTQGANAQGFVMQSSPNVTSGTPTGWTAVGYQFANNGSNGQRWSISAYAVCGS